MKIKTKLKNKKKEHSRNTEKRKYKKNRVNEIVKSKKPQTKSKKKN